MWGKKDDDAVSEIEENVDIDEEDGKEDVVMKNDRMDEDGGSIEDMEMEDDEMAG